jgi:hypothetical protein
MTADDRRVLADIAAHAGQVDRETVERTAFAVVAAIGAVVPAGDRARFAAELPPALGSALIAANPSTPLPALVSAPGTTSGRSHELVASACLVLAATLRPTTLTELRGLVPAAVGRLLVAPSPSLPHGVRPGEPHTLADGRPGSRHPISESPVVRRRV